VVCRMLEGLKGLGDHRALVLPDHYTPLSLRTHASDPVPFAMCGTGVAKEGQDAFCERMVGLSTREFKRGFELMDFFLTS